MALVRLSARNVYCASFNLKDRPEVIHVNLDKFARIQELLANKIRSAGATSEGREPLRLVIPPGVPIELRDSGLAISAHAGDTQQTIATTYHVPLWALTQINKLSETVALTESQRIVIPHSIGQKLPSSTAQSPVAATRRRRNINLRRASVACAILPH